MKFELVAASFLLVNCFAARGHRHPHHRRRYWTSSTSTSSGSLYSSTSSSSSSYRHRRRNSSDTIVRLDSTTDLSSDSGPFRFRRSTRKKSSDTTVVALTPLFSPTPAPAPEAFEAPQNDQDVVVVEIVEDIDADDEGMAVVAQNEEFKRAFVLEMQQKRVKAGFHDLSSEVVWGSWGQQWMPESSESSVSSSSSTELEVIPPTEVEPQVVMPKSSESSLSSSSSTELEVIPPTEVEPVWKQIVQDSDTSSSSGIEAQ